MLFLWKEIHPVFHFFDLNERNLNLIYPKICKEDQTVYTLIPSLFLVKLAE